jgi:hypothetical protein
MTANRQDLELFIPTQPSGPALRALGEASVVEAYANPVTMTSDTKEIDRFGGFTVATVAKGADYGFSTNTSDRIEMVARKIGGAAKIAEEDLVDTTMGESTMRMYEEEAGKALAAHYDNAALAVTAAQDGTTVKYTSLYRELTQAQTTPHGNYSANQNILQIERGDFIAGTTGYQAIGTWLGRYEESLFYDEGNTVVLMSSAFRGLMRNQLNPQTGLPYFQDVRDGQDAQFFGYRGRMSRGLRTSAVDTQTPTGNPIAIIGNRTLMNNGKARTSAGMAPGNPGTQWQRAANGIGFLSDEALMKATMRRAFRISTPLAFSVLEIVPDVP